MLPQALQAAGATALLILAAAGAGSPLFRLLENSYARWERVTLSLLGGWGLLSLALYVIGQWRFSKHIIFIVSVGFAVLGIRNLWGILRGMERMRFPLERRAWLPAGLVIGVVGTMAMGGLAPVVGDWGTDTVAYHLLGPKVWLRTGVIRPVADNSHTAFPQTAETMDAALMAVGGPVAPGFCDFFTFALLLAVCGSLAVRAGLDASGAWWVAALVATMPAVFSGANGGFVDGLFAAFLLATIRVTLSAENAGGWTVFGIFRGLLIGTKYTGLMTVPILAAGVLFLQRSRAEEERVQGMEIAWAGFATVLIAAPYYLRNWLCFGFPIFPPPPFAAHWIKPGYFSPGALAEFYAITYRHGAGMGKSLRALLLLPFDLTFHTADFNGAGGIGLSGLALAPFGFCAARQARASRALALFAILLTLAWFYSIQESRYLIPVYLICSIFAVLGWNYMKSTSLRLSRILSAAVVLISVLYGLFMIGKSEASPIHAVFSPKYSALRQQMEIPYAESFAYLNHADAVNKVLILDRSVPPFYLEKHYIKPVGQWGELTVPGITNPAQELQRLKTDGITHVLDVNSELSAFQVAPPADELQLVFEAKNQRVYRVK